MDFSGQQLAEKIYQFLILLFGFFGFLIGFLLESFQITFYSIVVAATLSCILCVPDWNFYNKNPHNWLTPSTLIATETVSRAKRKHKGTQ
jgi:signal peptidase complex subunit 1